MSKKLHVSKKLPVVVIDNERNDDWMKALPGYADEVAITESALRNTSSAKKRLKLSREA